MYFKSSRAFIFAAVATGLGLSVVQASAQQAKFHLPFEAHWGRAVLEPGDYRLLTPVAEPVPIFHLSGDGKSILVVSTLTGMEPVSNRSSIELVNVNGAYFVKQYKSGSTGKVFSYPVPRPVAESSIASGGATAISVEEGTK